MAKPRFELAVKTLVCKGCKICVEVCPENCIEIKESFNERGYYFPAPVAMEKCNGCGACAKLCPDYAVTVYKITETAE